MRAQTVSETFILQCKTISDFCRPHTWAGGWIINTGTDPRYNLGINRVATMLPSVMVLFELAKLLSCSLPMSQIAAAEEASFDSVVLIM